MAEAVVSLAVERIGDQLIQEAVLVRGVRTEVERLRAELTRMRCYLKDADLKQEQDGRVKNWVAEIRDAAYDAEDIIDTFIIKDAGREAGFCYVLDRLLSIFAKGFYLRKVGEQIKSIRAKIEDIFHGMQNYGIGEGEGSNSTSEMRRRLGRSYPHIEEEVVSLEGSTREVISQLMTEEERFRIVSIVGIGGLGKTTLAKKVYNHYDVKRHFDCYAWAFVSQQCATKDVLQEILTKVTRANRDVYERMTEEELVEKLYHVLSEKQYLVVLDDIWGNEAWDSLKPAFPNGRKGSKVLFTTRNKEVALYADPWSSPIEPPFLTHEESWELLCKKAFCRNVASSGCPPEFEKLGREMVRKCGGLPLAIVLLGGLLATKRSLSEWEVVQRNINAHLNEFQQQQYGGVYGILDRSYHELPFHLKPCFLYFGLFPEDWEIPRRKLIQLWIAEGFVPHPFEGEGEEMMEDLAEQYLNDLINRCMVQVGQWDSTGRGVKTCRVHDLMRDLCVSKAKDENFLTIVQQQANLTPDDPSVIQLTNGKLRRIAIHPLKYFREHQERYVPKVQGFPHLRSLLCFVKVDQSSLMGKSQEISIYKEFRLLRVLELERVNINGRCRIPEAIGNLIHLRYLGLKSTMSYIMPHSIANLVSLRTLDLRGNGMITLPIVASKLVSLRHFLCDDINEGQYRMDTFRNLLTLKYINVKSLIRGDAMLKLTNLRNLGIRFETSAEVEMFLQSPIMASGCLRSLNMEIVSMNPFSNLESLSHCQHLAKLRIIGRIVDGHHNLKFLPVNLSKLILRNSELQQDPMAILEKLPNLRVLHLGHVSYSGSKMVCSANGFPHLEILRFESLSALEEWHVAEGAMSSLRSLYIFNVCKLRMIPEEFKSIKTLQELCLVSMPTAFVNRIQVVDGVEGEDFYKVQHVPSQLIFFQTANE